MSRSRPTAEQLAAEREREFTEYARQIVAAAAPMTDDERRKIVEMFRPVARKIRAERLADGGPHAA
jgi:hypothetical protein